MSEQPEPTRPTAEPTAADLFDPAAFAVRVAEARERRMEVLARRAAPDADFPPKPARLPHEASGGRLATPSAPPPPAPPPPARSWLRRLLGLRFFLLPLTMGF